MKVIFLQDVPKVGQSSDLKDVSDGYAVNFLFPRGLAERATEQRLQELEKQQRAHAATSAAAAQKHINALEKLSGKTIEMRVKANEHGHLFKGLHKKDVLQALQTTTGAAIPENVLELTLPIKEVGEYALSATVEGTTAQFTLAVKSA